MYASTSKVLAKSGGLSLRAFSTTSTAMTKRQTFVELLQEVPGLGKAFDRILVAPGYARNDLVPGRKARFIPFKESSQRQVLRMSDSERASHSLRIGAPGSSASWQQRSASDLLPTTQELLNAIHSIQSPITFSLRTVSPTSTSLHGSLNLSNVHDRIAEDYGLTSKEVEIDWVEQENGARMKELGKWEALVKLRHGGREEVPIEVEVVRLETAEQ
ncbi:hypothetical protein L202_01245 [Cryptococcus amylolentus CBS 6039]|uniref:Ribosomal protein L9 domain-containing protein n=2 Tax=Cryptococcus amylolentus TaxID=104669 RepID=A0A1E3I3R2_9TREE|nr:hypothetical protein L202_01245 [Cryptococcus amylolentus CBS 6039]ODN83015.1 hypothetical protein L202_01245 [Cryptococcus amylolentus CBS 6039]ODO10637.1 hypothetical protein I350_01234 [Cryptococcus amylolentus CBS 6273]